MFRSTLGVLGALATSLPSPAPADVLASLEAEQRALFEQAAPAVVVISSDAAVSAGFFAAPGLVVTSAHGLLGSREPRVTLRDGRTVRGEVVTSSPRGLDLALVRVPAAGPAHVLAPARDAPLRAGDVVVALGHGDGNLWSFSTGIVSNPLADGPDGSLVRLQLGVRPGASGGPVVDRLGRLVGVVVHGDPGTLAFAIRAETVLRAFPELAQAAAGQPDPAAAAVAVSDEQGDAPPLRAPELIVGPADPRPIPARVARPSAARAHRVPVIPPPRRAAAVHAAFLPAPAEDSVLGELVPLAIVATGGLALAALVLGAVLLLAPAQAPPVRPGRPRRPFAPRLSGARPRLTRGASPP